MPLRCVLPVRRSRRPQAASPTIWIMITTSIRQTSACSSDVGAVREFRGTPTACRYLYAFEYGVGGVSGKAPWISIASDVDDAATVAKIQKVVDGHTVSGQDLEQNPAPGPDAQDVRPIGAGPLAAMLHMPASGCGQDQSVHETAHSAAA